MAGELKAYIYLIMDAQLIIQNGTFVFTVHYENGNIMHDRTLYGIVRGTNWGWKDISSLRLTRKIIP